ncbi:MAG: DUF2555 domain-containing protein [Alkalinema sp. RU_4_3]|nr:DUF2555 domain-containing protein [Alkalinema sp. RU_4_3]
MASLTLDKLNVEKLTPEQVAEVAARLEQDEYDSIFDGLNDWHLLRAIAFSRPEMVENYMHLLDLEAYDES